MTNIIDGKAIAQTIHEDTSQRVQILKQKGITPKLAVILIGEDKPSQTYVKKKGEAAQKLGMDFSLFTFDANIERDELIKRIIDIQADSSLHGLIIQLPVPDTFYPDIFQFVEPDLDVDCLTHNNLGKLLMGTEYILPPTPGAVLSILDSIDANVKGKNVVIVGAGVLVGKPLAMKLMNMGATVTVCNEFTTDLEEKTQQADILISGVGKKHIITESMVKEGAIVIDAGVDFDNNHMFGDVDFDNVCKKSTYITPTPGGVGPITVARLLANVVTMAELQ